MRDQFADYYYRALKEEMDVNVYIKALEIDVLLEGTRLRNLNKLLRLGHLKLLQYEHISHSPLDLEGAMQIFHTCMYSGHHQAEFCFDAACMYADLCLQYRDASSAVRPFSYAMKLLPQTVDPGLNIFTRYSIVNRVRGAVDTAVAVAIQSGNLDLALEWFESGRCMIWGHISRLRPPLAQISDLYPILAAKMQHIISDILSLEATIEKPVQYPGFEGATNRHQKLSSEYEKLLVEARNSPGLEECFKERTTVDFKNVGCGGSSHIVILNVAWWRCDALILQPKSPELLHVYLPDALPSNLKSLSDDFRSSLNNSNQRLKISTNVHQARRRSLEIVLAELWRMVVEPIFRKLGWINQNILNHSELPRITWCASGPLSFLPFHAAGIYDGKIGRKPAMNSFELAVHSYVPSLTSLLSAIQEYQQTKKMANPSVFAVSQPVTPHHASLPSTVTEVEVIRNVVGRQNVTWLNDYAGNKVAVLEQLKLHPWVHFACHAVQDEGEPLKSGLLLHDGLISLRDIMRLKFNGALTVLLACQTAAGETELPDEAVHLTAGMLMAGFQNVVGTIWSINDKDAPVFAEEFYSYLVNEAHRDSLQSAQAVHYAVSKLRDKVGKKQFLQWVPFIHVGI